MLTPQSHEVSPAKLRQLPEKPAAEVDSNGKERVVSAVARNTAIAMKNFLIILLY